MKKKFYSVVIVFFISIYSWNNETSKGNIIFPKKNICGMIGEIAFENINFNGKLEIECYQKPSDEKGDPRWRHFPVSIIPSDNKIYVKQIIFFPDDKIIKKIKFNQESWYQVKIVYSNFNSEIILLPVSTKIFAKNIEFNRLESIEIPLLIGKGLIIKNIKEELKKSDN